MALAPGPRPGPTPSPEAGYGPGGTPGRACVCPHQSLSLLCVARTTQLVQGTVTERETSDEGPGGCGSGPGCSLASGEPGPWYRGASSVPLARVGSSTTLRAALAGLLHVLLRTDAAAPVTGGLAGDSRAHGPTLAQSVHGNSLLHTGHSRMSPCSRRQARAEARQAALLPYPSPQAGGQWEHSPITFTPPAWVVSPCQRPLPPATQPGSPAPAKPGTAQGRYLHVGLRFPTLWLP